MPYVRYNPIATFIPEEIALREQYPFTSTNTLEAGSGLHQHRHHSDNTHIVLGGSLCIGISANLEFLNEDGSIPRRRGGLPIDMPPNVDYMATTDEGCTFIEGHKLLSPTTAERLYLNGTFVPCKREQGYYYQGRPLAEAGVPRVWEAPVIAAEAPVRTGERNVDAAVPGGAEARDVDAAMPGAAEARNVDAAVPGGAEVRNVNAAVPHDR